ncbi:hypothetical protein [Gloeobacter morelensis]|uniref:AbiTii domain-containing protein n=1 Tax=Gloeobacter morelensis MG652769 TaxID=2781736 RepID=A0ABY3PT33_9CYAN|nr:hypothetical protein ISF26_05435 [Gloeobacter morelensis MG652769]
MRHLPPVPQLAVGTTSRPCFYHLNWVDRELAGYPDKTDLPDYRILSGAGASVSIQNRSMIDHDRSG